MNEPVVSGRGDDLHRHVVAEIKKRIIQWEFPPGFRLFEQDVCEQYGVSRSPAREAFRTLEADGYLEKKPRRGYLVRQPDPGEAREMYEVRLALELRVFEQVASRGTTDPRIEALRITWGGEVQSDLQTSTEFAELDRRFHETFAEIHGNRTLLGYLYTIDERLHVFRTVEFGADETRKKTCEQHMEILNAVAEGDVNAARSAVQTNIESAIVNVEAVIKEALSRSFIQSSQRGTEGA